MNYFAPYSSTIFIVICYIVHFVPLSFLFVYNALVILHVNTIIPIK